MYSDDYLLANQISHPLSFCGFWFDGDGVVEEFLRIELRLQLL